jgi:hypothetical protein
MADSTPSERLAAKLTALQLDEREAQALNRILHRAEGGDARDVEVEGFGMDLIPPLMPGGLPIVTPARLRKAMGVTRDGCDDEPTVMCGPK